MKKLSATLVLASLSFSTGYAASPEEVLASKFRAAAALIDTQMTLESTPGAAIGVVHDQELIWSHQYGVESYATGTAVSDDTLFSICSVSKLFNGIATMSLVDDGLLELDAPVASYLGGASTRDETGAEETATVRNILSHVSGLPREGVRDYWSDHSFPDSEGLRVTVSEQDQLYRPFDFWQYSNLGMSMLGAVVAEVSGEPWGDYVQETIFGPLGMERSATDMPFDQVGHGFARGHYIRTPDGKRKPVEEHTFRAFAPAAGVASSVADMSKFLSWHFRLHENGGEEILKATTLKQMQRVHWIGADFDEPAWGLAYGSRRYGDKTLWGHGGYCPGTRTELVMRLPSKIGVVMMLTANDVSPGALVQTVYSLTEGSIEAAYSEEEAADNTAGDESADASFAEFEGLYLVENYPDDMYVGVTEGGLFALPLLSSDAVSGMQEWVHEEGDRFRRKRDDGTLAEPVDFERDEEGRVVSVIHHGYRSFKAQK